jgi:hypothetical protein
MASDEKVSTMRGVGYRVYFLVMHWQLAPWVSHLPKCPQGSKTTASP